MAGRLVSVRTDTRNEINAERLSNIPWASEPYKFVGFENKPRV